MDDLPALRTTMQGVTAILHLVGDDDPGQRTPLDCYARHTTHLIEAAREAGVNRIVYLSRLGADRASAYPVFRAMGEAESLLRQSGLDCTILQTAVAYGPEDAFVNALVMLAKVIPFALPIPDAGLSRFQPLWVEDLVTCLVFAGPAGFDRADGCCGWAGALYAGAAGAADPVRGGDEPAADTHEHAAAARRGGVPRPVSAAQPGTSTLV